jgi:thioredoxin reductase (NADPH)
MAKPVLFSVDDDPDVLRSVERDIRRRYNENYRVLKADSGATALEALKKLKLRNEAVALFLADQRMPHMSGVEFLEEAMQLFPEAKKVLLTAYADTNAAIAAINTVKIDYYLLKPWDPPESNLYPVIDDLLDDWQAQYRPAFEGVRVIGHRWSPKSHQVKDFLARNQIPYRWYDIELDSAGEASRLMQLAAITDAQLPLVLFPDGSSLTEPSNTQIGEKVGLKTRAEKPFYDLVIVGSGPAGLAAAVYGGSEGLRTVVVEREAPGGQAGTSSRIENYLGFPVGLSGGDLARRAVSQATRFGAEILTPQEVVGVHTEGQYRTVKLVDGSEINCHALLVATGVSYRRLDVPGAERLTGAGVYYGAATTEALACEGEQIFIVGGANSAGQAAMFFSRYAWRVTMLVRASSLTQSMSQYLIDEIATRPNIVVRPFTQVVEVKGESVLEELVIANAQTGEQETVPGKALFIFIGAEPRTEWLEGIVERDEQGFIVTGPELLHTGKRPRGWNLERDPYLLESSVPGIFAAGDVRHGSVKRVASGVGEGAMTVQLVHRYLSEVK